MHGAEMHRGSIERCREVEMGDGEREDRMGGGGGAKRLLVATPVASAAERRNGVLVKEQIMGTKA